MKRCKDQNLEQKLFDESETEKICNEIFSKYE